MFKLLVSVYLLLGTTSVSAANWAVDYANSQLAFSGMHAGNEFNGIFEEWQADIEFDTENLENSTVKVLIKTGTAVTGNGLYDGTLKGDDWFNVKQFETATFEAGRFSMNTDSSYTAEGYLTIKDTKLAIALRFNLDVTGNTAKATANHTLDRLQYGLGVQSDADAAWVSREIGIQMHLVASRN